MLFILAVGFGVNLFTLIQLVSGKSLQGLPGKIGLTIVFVWMLRFLLIYLKFEGSAEDHPVLLILDQNLFLLDSVLLWLYSRSLLKPEKLPKRFILHFIPFLIALTLALINAILYPREVVRSYRQNLASYQGNEPVDSIEILVFILIILLIAVIYFSKSLILIRRYNFSLFDTYSNVENRRATWLITFQRLWIILFVVPVFVYFVNYIHPVLDMMSLGLGLIISLVFLSFFFNSNLLRQSYSSIEKLQKLKTQKKTESMAEQDPEQLQKLKDLMENEKYYLDENLTLQQLASYLEIKPVELTGLIKQSEYENFYDLVNSYRIEAVKEELLSTNEQIIVIAYQNGFNSKSAFNNIFKQKTGQTPREFRLAQK
jgi:AraC-like DNA-binding protein